MNETTARHLLREMVRLNNRHTATGREVSRFSVERDELVQQSIEEGFGHLTDYAAYDYPNEV